METITWIEASALGVVVRESLWVYPTLLTLHAIGLAFLVGVSVALDLRILGVASGLRLAPLERFFPVMYAGFWVNAMSGIALFVGAATKMATDPVFYIKMGCIVLAIAIIRLQKNVVFGPGAGLNTGPLSMNTKLLAAASLVFWAGAIVAGRLTAYSFFR